MKLKLSLLVILASFSWHLSAEKSEEVFFPKLLKSLKKHQYKIKDQLKYGLSNTNQKMRKELATDICSQNELIFQNIEKNVLAPFFESFKKGNNFFKNNVTGPASHDFSCSHCWEMKRSFDEINHYVLSSNKTKETLNNALKKYRRAFKDVHGIDYAVKKYSFGKIRDGSYLEATLSLNLNLLGETTRGERRSDQHKVILNLTKSSAKKEWKITSFKSQHANSFRTKRRPIFKRQISKSIGSVPIYLRREAIRRGGYALSLTDVNQDGFSDIYIGSSQKGDLLINEEGKSFKRANEKAFPFLKETLVKAAIFADYTADNNLGLIMTRFSIEKDKNNFGYNDIVFYKSKKNSFYKVDNPISDRLPAQYAMPAAVGDFNNDGHNDVYVGFPGKKDFSDLSPDLKNEDLVRHGFFFNKKGKGFEDKSNDVLRPQGKIPRSQELRHFFPHSALAIDYDQDRDTDVIVIDDRNNISPIFQNNNNKTFSQAAEKIGLGNRGLGMSVAPGDFNNDGHIDFIFTNVRLSAADRVESCLVSNFNTSENIFGDEGLRYFKSLKNGKFADHTKSTGMDFIGDATAGVETLDYNNDGLLDIMLINGLWSGNSPSQSLDSSFVLSVLKKHTGAKEEIRFSSFFPMAQSNFMRMLMGFQGDTLTGKHKKGIRPSLGGYQRNRLYRNMGDGTFIDVGFLEGVDSISDGYIVSKADLNKDGKIDLVFRNADPGTKDYQFPILEVFLNQSKNKNKSIALKLIDPNGSKDGIGSYATLEIAGRKTIQHLVSNLGSAQSERILSFGIGSHDIANKLTIHWSTGGETKFSNIKGGFYVITKGKQEIIPLLGKR